MSVKSRAHRNVTIIYTVTVQSIRAEKLIGVYDFAKSNVCMFQMYLQFNNIVMIDIQNQLNDAKSLC